MLPFGRGVVLRAVGALAGGLMVVGYAIVTKHSTTADSLLGPSVMFVVTKTLAPPTTTGPMASNISGSQKPSTFVERFSTANPLPE